jgi:hypothetical protein
LASRELRKRKTGDAKLTDVMAERLLPSGKRRLSLIKSEKKAIHRSLMIERAVALFLDIDHDHTWDEIARELGVSMVSLKDLTKSDEFVEKYSEFYAELGHDPRLRASQAALVDMLPAAVCSCHRICPRVFAITTFQLPCYSNWDQPLFSLPMWSTPKSRSGKMRPIRDGPFSKPANIFTTAPTTLLPQ